MTTVTVHVFAVLKDYFKPSLEVTLSSPTIECLLTTLIQVNPTCETIIKRSRFAINERIVDAQYKLNDNDQLFVLPPSSGG